MTEKRSAVAKTLLAAISNEIRARDFYLAIAGKVRNPLVRRKFLGLAEDELQHRETLSRLYWAQTGLDPGDIQTDDPSTEIPNAQDMSLVEALEMAMKAEKEAVETYSRMAEEVEDAKSQGFLEYLAEFENGHYETLARELARIKGDPGWEDQGIS